jgi:hypothetical protein
MEPSNGLKAITEDTIVSKMEEEETKKFAKSYSVTSLY